MILGLIDEAVQGGARQSEACHILGLDRRTVQRWRSLGIGDDGRAGPRTRPTNSLSADERRKVIEIATSPEFRDSSPKQIVPTLADRGEYVASESTIYRVLRAEKLDARRGTSAAPTKRHRPTEYVATGPNQVWSWDITYLRTRVRGQFFYLYMLLDVWSRKAVGYAVHDVESGELAAEMIERAYIAESVARGAVVLHSDNGGPMKCATLLVKLQDLEIAPSFSRPSVSNDNPFSESLFRTAKYRPAYPTRGFDDLASARRWTEEFVSWYNGVHLHGSIGFVTPADRHAGRDCALLEDRREVYDAARQRHPERWSGGARPWTRPAMVVLNKAPFLAEAAPA
jgi:putative transposase